MAYLVENRDQRREEQSNVPPMNKKARLPRSSKLQQHTLEKIAEIPRSSY